MLFTNKFKVCDNIPTASMPDVVFMLLLFFIVTTVFQQFVGIPVDLPKAKRIIKLEAKKNITSIYVNERGDISIDDKAVKVSEIFSIISKKRHENLKLIVSMKIDRATPMGIIIDIQNQLRRANALIVNYNAKFNNIGRADK